MNGFSYKFGHFFQSKHPVVHKKEISISYNTVVFNSNFETFKSLHPIQKKGGSTNNTVLFNYNSITHEAWF